MATRSADVEAIRRDYACSRTEVSINRAGEISTSGSRAGVGPTVKGRDRSTCRAAVDYWIVDVEGGLAHARAPSQRLDDADEIILHRSIGRDEDIGRRELISVTPEEH